MTDGLFLGAKDDATTPQYLVPKRANRHGLVAGATGTGKTVTLQVLAQACSDDGVPVFLADVKGDLSGIALPGSEQAPTNEAFQKRAAKIGLRDYRYSGTPAVFWDLFGKDGHPVRATVSSMGPLLFARLLGLNDTQEGVLNIAFKVADERQWLLLDLKDLRQLLLWCSDNQKDLAASYGHVSAASVGAIQRQLLVLEQQGGDRFLGEPALHITDMIRVDGDGHGQVNILAADKLMASPRLYATFLLWMLSELFEELPEIGDPPKPKLLFFFDEAHLLFDDAPKVLLDKVERVVRLIRSKGVGVYFITQNPADIPDKVAGQLGNRVQHALRAYTPADQKAVKAAAATFRPNPALRAEDAIRELKTGEALVSLLQEDGAPSMVERVLIRPPSSRLGSLSESERRALIATSPCAGKYEQTIDRESAFEILSKEKANKTQAEETAKASAVAAKADAQAKKEALQQERDAAREKAAKDRAYRNSAVGQMGTFVGQIAKSVLAQEGRKFARGVLGNLLKGR